MLAYANFDIKCLRYFKATLLFLSFNYFPVFLLLAKVSVHSSVIVAAGVLVFEH